MTVGTNLVFMYITNDYKSITRGLNDTCETVCNNLCKELGISPSARLLFSLRISSSVYWLPGCRQLEPNIKYDFRMRFKVSDLIQLQKLDKQAYNYYFAQVQNDFVSSKIPEIEYSKHKEKMVGLALTDMYKEMIENKCTVDYLEKNYKQYIPKEVVRKHSIFLQSTLSKKLKNIKNMSYNVYYIKNSYLEQINILAPNYLAEEYTANTSYLEENGIRNGSCPVKVQFSPYHTEQPGLRIYYAYKHAWKHIARIEDIYAIIIEKDIVKIEMKNQPSGFQLVINPIEQLESFVSCITGYYRLTVKWTVNLCQKLPSPSLEELRTLKCHGPIGGEFSYTKIEEKNSIPGSYIIRQCGEVYDTYYIDMITKGNQPETFKITNEHKKWHFHRSDGVRTFDDLTILAKNIQTESKQKFRIAPSEYDKPPLLLLCLPPYQHTVKKTVSDISEIRESKARCIDAENELQLYKNSQRECNGGMFTQMRADWKLPGDKKLEVTLKMLKPNKFEYLPEFLRLANLWAKLESSEILKLYGVSLYKPIAMVLESTKYGPLDEFLRHNNKLLTVCLIDAAYSLARALHYLQENNIVHSNLRCSSLQVVRFESPNLVVTKLSDPAFQKQFTQNDLPWIAPEYYNNLQLVKYDLKADIWAYSTTLWEIFSYGKRPTEFHSKNRKLPGIKGCPLEICEIMKEGWEQDPDKRFSPQTIFSRLICARELQSHAYSSISDNTIGTSTSSNGSKDSLLSNDTENTQLNSINGTDSDCGSSTCSALSDTSTHHDLLIPDHIIGGIIENGFNPSSSPSPHTDCDHLECIIEHEDYKIIFQGKIGIGHYGTVYRGQLEYADDKIQEVAIKRLGNGPLRDQSVISDFVREIDIMKRLDHPNIVKIINFIEEPEISIIMEYIKHRSFLMYLSSHSPQLTTQKLLKFAKDIASGMEYLRYKHIVHRDLAARNILVDSDECVKISDFGLAQVAGPNGYYTITSTRDIPIKWYAPETLHSKKYSYESDVWSYGVTLFEMFSRGQEPNLLAGPDLTQLELLEHLHRGLRLNRPILCPENIYDSLMMSCWHIIPQQRPDFTTLLVEIMRLISEYGECI